MKRAISGAQLWPAAIIAVLVGQVGFGLWMSHVANDDPHFAVEPNYYARAVNWDATMAQSRLDRALGWQAVATLTRAKGTAATLRIALSLVEIQEREAFLRRAALLLELLQAQRRHFNSRERIAGSRPQLVNLQVHRYIGIAEQVLQKAGIADFGRALTADVDRTAKRDKRRAAATHPRCGTPP